MLIQLTQTERIEGEGNFRKLKLHASGVQLSP